MQMHLFHTTYTQEVCMYTQCVHVHMVSVHVYIVSAHVYGDVSIIFSNCLLLGKLQNWFWPFIFWQTSCNLCFQKVLGINNPEKLIWKEESDCCIHIFFISTSLEPNHTTFHSLSTLMITVSNLVSVFVTYFSDADVTCTHILSDLITLYLFIFSVKTWWQLQVYL